VRKDRPWSITARLTFAFALCVALIQLGAGIYLYWSVKQDILAQDRDALVDHIREVRLVMSDDKSAPAGLSRQWESHVLSRQGIYVRILTSDGAMVSETAGMATPATAFPPPVGPITIPRQSIRWQHAIGDQEYMLMSARAVAGRTGNVQVIQAALDLDESERDFAAYLNKLVGVWFGAVLAAIAIGYVGMRRGLSEVRRIAQAAGRINAAHFDERLSNRPMPAELKELAEAFDAMVSRLRDAFTQLSRFSADLAHEFRTPLNNLISAASVTLSRARTADEYRELIERSMEEYEALNRMIEAMLFLARTENRQIARHVEPISAAAEFAKVMEFFEALAEERGVSLASEGDIRLVADPVLLRRALSNLVANALRHCARGDTILLKATQSPAGQARLQVIDTGEGIDTQHLPHLFDRFSQVDPARSEGNVGPGLTIVKSIADLHGGQITVVSQPGSHTAFTLDLPRAAQCEKFISGSAS